MSNRNPAAAWMTVRDAMPEAAVVGAAPGPGKSLVLSPWRSDGRGGVELRAWPEGRLWPLSHVHMVYAVWAHVVARGCTACNWVGHGAGMVELCEPGLLMTPAVTGE